MSLDFSGRVAIVTGAGQGLGRTHALALAKRGAKVVVNDLGAATDGTGGDVSPAQKVVAEIEAMGGEAIANGANVCDEAQVAAMVAGTMEKWGRIDILVNNAGILRDKTFSKMSLDDFRAVVDVHLMGSVTCTKAVWEIMREQAYGRIVMTTSSSGLYGNFGQSNYGAAKLALVGLMNTLHLEGAKFNIRVNSLAPVAATRMTEGLMPEEAFAALKPELVSEGLVTLVHEDAPSRMILCAGAGGFARANIFETKGIHLSEADTTAENLVTRMDDINNEDGHEAFTQGAQQSMKFLSALMK
ncbi:MAG: SDR family NAD(P)-dependent oxidoreductase [Sphingomonadales bacterium]|jgi:NAD(P)-dependent dehydrogenase (short-subunit alcohol dehydrogenase family)